MGFPKAISVAPNDILCHGVPDEREIQGKPTCLLYQYQMVILLILT